MIKGIRDFIGNIKQPDTKGEKAQELTDEIVTLAYYEFGENALSNVGVIP